MDACAHPERKRHAQLRHQSRATPLWVGDPDDWALVRQKPRPPLVCPAPGCDVELISYENPSSASLGRRSSVAGDALSADDAGGGPGRQQSLQVAQDRVEAQAGAAAFGSWRRL